MSGRDLSIFVAELAGEKLKESETVADWLDKTLQKADKVFRGTHGLKFSHSAIPHGGVLAKIENPDTMLVGTHSVTPPRIDTFCDAAALGLGKLLDISVDGDSIADQVVKNNPVSFQSFTNDEAQLRNWMNNLAVAIRLKKAEPHSLGKQFYFPVDEGYHLLSPLHSSSLSHVIYKRVRDVAAYTEHTKVAREAMNKKRHCDYDLVVYKNLARIKYGGAQPQNVSLLNSQRSGVSYLLSCAPPNWQSQIRLPIKGNAALWRMLGFRVRQLVRTFREFLASVERINNAHIRDTRADFIDQLIDELLGLRAGILEVGKPGWSRESELTVAEQCFLDPMRVDDDESLFMTVLETREWEQEISNAFARFVNDKLSGIRTQSGKQLRDLGDVEHREWRDDLRDRLVEFRHFLETLT